jgi:hypothetical protein
MSLDLNKLERVVELAEGVIRARCPACAESGSDRTGEHLRIYPDGKFGCCVFPRDREHRKRIFALVGERSRQAIRVRVAVAKASGPVRSGILGLVGQVFGGPVPAYSTIGEPDAPDGSNEVGQQFEQPDGTDGVNEVEPLSECDRTARTGEPESDGDSFEEGRTLRTPQLSICIAQQNLEGGEDNSTRYTRKDNRPSVRSVRQESQGLEPPKSADDRPRMPFFTPGGSLSIPFDSPERYHWWKHGPRLSIAETAAEARERQKEVENGSAF